MKFWYRFNYQGLDVYRCYAYIKSYFLKLFKKTDMLQFIHSIIVESTFNKWNEISLTRQ